MADFNKRRRWRGPALGGRLQRGARFCFAAHDGEATTSRLVEWMRPELLYAGKRPTVAQMVNHATALRSIGAVKVKWMTTSSSGCGRSSVMGDSKPPRHRDGFSRLHHPVFLAALRSAASFARRHVLRIAELLASESIVARRYVGALGGSSGRESVVLFFVGRGRFAREFEVYFREDTGRGIAPAATLFRGNLVQYLLHRARLAQEAREADLVAHEVFPGALAGTDGHLHYPMLQGSLHVEASIDRQICRMRSRAQRRRARDLLRRGGYREWVEHGPEALEQFRATLYEPYVRARFGAWGFINDPAELRRLYARKGYILFVAPSAGPSEPVCGALLLDEGSGVVAYFLNGFSDAGRRDPARIAEHTMALELAVMKHAIERRLLRIELGYTRAILSDGLFTHKRRLGGDFTPQAGSPLFRVRVRPTRRAAIFARFPLLAVGPHGWRALLGFDDEAPRLTKRAWRGMFKSYRQLGLWQATVWTNASGERRRDPLGEPAFRSALVESLDLPGRIDFLIDGEPSESKR